MINALLGEADQEATNPHYRSAATMLLYDKARVAKAEESEEFERRKALAATRSARMKAVAAKRAANLIEWAKTVPIQWIEAPKTSESAMQKGILQWEDRNERTVDRKVDRATRQRWARNYIRHCCMQYEERLDETSTKPGVQAAYEVIRKRCEAMIDARYPGLE